MDNLRDNVPCAPLPDSDGRSGWSAGNRHHPGPDRIYSAPQTNARKKSAAGCSTVHSSSQAA